MSVVDIQQGQIWWADLDETKETNNGRRYPVLIVQSNPFNRSIIETVVCVVLASNWRLAAAPGNVLLSHADTGLSQAAVARVSQLLTLNRRFLYEYVGTVPPWVLESVLDGVQLMFGR
jgi:mRNA interferase MazF